ncbi:unnamed protein product [Gadus morhua 'NCC']
MPMKSSIHSVIHTQTHTHTWRGGGMRKYTVDHGDIQQLSSISLHVLLPSAKRAGEGCVMASYRADAQLGMLNTRAGIPGKDNCLGTEWTTDRKTEKGVRQRGQRKHKFKELERERGKDREARAAVPLSFDYVDRPVLSTDLEKATWTASTKRPSFHRTHTHTHTHTDTYIYIQIYTTTTINMRLA